MNKKKVFVWILIAILIALIAYAVAHDALDTASVNNVFEIVLNNTDLGDTNGTGDRQVRTVYYTNTSPIAIALLGHVVGTGSAQELNLNLSVNNTVVQDIDTNTNPGGGIHDHASIYFIIPKNSNYSVDNSTSILFLEWREYPILAGKNGTLSINQTTLINQTVSDAQMNTKVNKSGDKMTGRLDSTGQIVLNYLGAVPVNNNIIVHPNTGTNAATVSLARDSNTQYTFFDFQTFGILSATNVNWLVSMNGNTNNISISLYDGANVKDVFRLYNDGNISFPFLTSSTSAALCIDAIGNIYRSTNASSNYLTC